MAIASSVILAGAPGWAAEDDVARLVEEAKREGEVHYIDATIQPKTHARLEGAFRKRYGLPDSFKVTHTLRGTGEVVASVQQEIKAGRHTIDLIWVGAPAFFKAAAREGHFLPYVSPEWKHYERKVRQAGIDAGPPHWVTPIGYAFVPVWNRKCPGFGDLQVRSYRDMVNPAFKGRAIIADVRKSFTHAATWLGLKGALGGDFFPKFVEATQPVIIFRTEEMLQKTISCEYPIALSQLPGRVYQRQLDDPSLNLAVAWPQEGIVLLGVPLAIVKGTVRPKAARLFMDFLLSEEGVREFVAGEAQFTFREGFRVPEGVRPYAPAVDTVKVIPLNWKMLDSLAEVRKIQDEFRRVLNVD